MSTPARWCLQCYSVCLGCSLSFSSFVWMSLVLFALSRTDPRSDELMTERYLECSLGLLGFTSSLALVYGAFVESRTWLSVWTIGSATVLVCCFLAIAAERSTINTLSKKMAKSLLLAVQQQIEALWFRKKKIIPVIGKELSYLGMTSEKSFNFLPRKINFSSPSRSVTGRGSFTGSTGPPPAPSRLMTPS